MPPPQPIVPARPADPYNCADGFANWQAGQFRKKSGAAGFTARVARTREVDARHRRSRTTAMQGLPIGRRAGVSRRRLGAVPTRARAALQQLEGALELTLDGDLHDDAGPWGHLPVSSAGGALEILSRFT